MGIRVPPHYETAVEQIANELDYRAGPHKSVSKSEVARRALRLYFAALDQAGYLPPETRDLLDDDLHANGGGDLSLDVKLEIEGDEA
ncbi:hypothetical protein SAMN04488063_0112 [Halopelagius inordinatus]|uniref:Uncharacterized protein n=1 Tax=Halopelagius inordinatus TaxID=553467 RepID=A0A1I2X447_9EURY|nr:hypothetical protein [Halopelagius inordinatus]SFH07797.1 hypothetical protein SAMN04488063_0112 [Halopelagius inordinatus]